MSNEPKRSEDSPPNPRQNSGQITPFEEIRRTNPAGNEFWSSRDFARVLGYVNWRHFQAVIEKARTACFNSGQRVEDHFVEVTDMIEVGKGAKRPAKSVRYRG
jgi:DNA-damage-inducible protein D